MTTVRRVRPDDEPGIVAVHAAAVRTRWRGHYPAADVDAWVARGLAADTVRPVPGVRDVLVAAQAARVVGFGILDVPRAEVHALYVHPDAGGAGVGRRLLADLETVGRLRALDHLRLEASLNAVTFYAEAGWYRTGDALRTVPGGRDIACVAMEKPLATVRPVVRDEGPRDHEAVHAVASAAFGREAEADLVDRLREAGALVLSLVATVDGEIVGHVALSVVAVDGSLMPVVGLAPIAVRPALQGCGLGARLVEESLARALERGVGAVVVLGDPAYYARFGFRPARHFGLEYPEPVPDDAFMAAELLRGGLAGGRGKVRYDGLFASVA